MFAVLGKLKSLMVKSHASTLFLVVLLVQFGVSCGALEKTKNPQEKFIMANLFYQKAPEVKALYYQGYNAAIDYLKSHSKKSRAKNKCIVMDIDETILDNSPYQGWLFENKESYTSRTWEAWVAKESAKAVPGSLAFYKYALKKGYKIYLITNRKAHLMEATINNMRKAGFKVDPKDMIGRTNTSSKVERRNRLTKNCKLVLLAGDSLADFDERFEGSAEEREKALHQLADRWGRKYIIFPNPMYGDWTRKEAKNPLDSFKMD